MRIRNHIPSIFFQEIPSLLSIIGALLISVAIVISGAQKVFENLPEEHHLKGSQFLNSFYGTKSSSKQPWGQQRWNESPIYLLAITYCMAMRAIIIRSLCTFEGQKRFFKELFFVKLWPYLCTVSIQELFIIKSGL